ncbi:MAG: hypothetical protein P8173_13310 [Gammaproteobacteria bacterium]|jgi:hypothetical protein
MNYHRWEEGLDDSSYFETICIGAAVKPLNNALTGKGDDDMKNCHEEMIEYHDVEVTLPHKERVEMHDRRNANRKRLKNGLKRDGEPASIGCRSQGSYAMRTMVQQPDKDYDIDDGVYFDKESLKGPQGGDKSASDAKEMVRCALYDESFKRPPEKLKNCVRIYYDAGYHVDIPVYRQVTETNAWGDEVIRYELASSDWKQSDPLAVTDWFLEANKTQSPDGGNGGQLRRIVRLLKAFASSRQTWRDRIATGFMISILVVERYVADERREDKVLYDTMVAIRDRLNWDLEIRHPVIAGETLTKGPDDSRTKFLREKLDWAIGELGMVFDANCSRKQSLQAWDKVFNTAFFVGCLEGDEEKNQKNVGAGAAAIALGVGAAAALLIKGAEKSATEQPVDKRGGGRYA